MCPSPTITYLDYNNENIPSSSSFLQIRHDIHGERDIGNGKSQDIDYVFLHAITKSTTQTNTLSLSGGDNEANLVLQFVPITTDEEGGIMIDCAHLTSFACLSRLSCKGTIVLPTLMVFLLKSHLALVAQRKSLPKIIGFFM